MRKTEIPTTKKTECGRDSMPEPIYFYPRLSAIAILAERGGAVQARQHPFPYGSSMDLDGNYVRFDRVQLRSSSNRR